MQNYLQICINLHSSFKDLTRAGHFHDCHKTSTETEIRITCLLSWGVIKIITHE